MVLDSYEGLKEGAGWVTLAIETTDGKTLTERVYVSVYTKVERCTAIAEQSTNLYRGASTNADVENDDIKGTVSDKEQVVVFGACGEYYFIRVKESTKDSDVGYVKKNDFQVPIKGVEIMEQNMSIEEGESKQLNARTTPEIANNPDLLWKSEDETVLSVDASGKIKAVSEGTTMISAISKEDSTLSAATYVSIYKKIEETKGYIKKDTDLYAVGNNQVPIETGVATTEVTIVGTCKDYYRVIIDIPTIQEKYNGYCYIPKSEVTIPVTGIKLSNEELSLSPGQTAQLSAAIIPELADDHSVKWSSSKENIVTVNEEGHVFAKKVGTATVAAISADGSCSSQCIVHVTKEKKESAKVASKPVVSLKSIGMNSISVIVTSCDNFDGFIMYLNGKKYDDCKNAESHWRRSHSYNNLATNKAYRIKVKTYTRDNGKRKYSKYSDEQKIKVGKIHINANITAEKIITISWEKMKQVKNYEIYRAEEENKKYKRIYTLKGNKMSYKDKAVELDKKYYYKVKAVSANGKKVWSNVDNVTVYERGNAEKYIAKKYSAICTNNKNINAYNINGCYSPVKYKMVNDTLQIHVYLEFVTYSDTNKITSDNEKIFRKNKASVQSEIPTSEYISMFKTGIMKAYSGVEVIGGEGDFKEGINFNTELFIHDKTDEQKYHTEQKFFEVQIGGECPNCTTKGDHWYHAAGCNSNAWGYCEYGDDVGIIYMPTNEQVRENTQDGYQYLPPDYSSVAAHELGHILGLDDAYPADGVDRCADNNETGYEYREGRYDNLMKYHDQYKKINANGIEMMLKAINPKTGIPNFASQSFKSYGDEKISKVIQNHKDYQKDK